ncbi:prolipoprotein diacylglyceryl transferase [Tenacibaculum jejuense]|uniref:Prolipoprotein diacylglyceryl transferase n=1 Tax=Tenacibaculum jejuense TaxID=584609 RepID=A0A238U599_9FLAO|nr:prolipoprotein diacylglyceryl transferase family protein [Tenacibaculum jejuense]SNR14317.1 Prolipoprotein diacylglyceryl transferase [Tenacibaculum jejuense]
MEIPFEPILFGVKINIHLILEYLAFFLGYRYYAYLKKKSNDHILSENRLYIILGAAIGAFFGSRIVGFLEHPIVALENSLVYLFNVKTIMGGLFGGLLGVEISKKIIGEKQSSGDLFTLPIILGIFIGRIGCFLTGINEFTYGKETSFFMGMDLGDGLLRHPLAFYELIFLILLFFLLKNFKSKFSTNGDLFKVFMLSYFGFRFCIEFLKPNEFFVFGLSSIQILCITCWLYYYKFILKAMNYAR